MARKKPSTTGIESKQHRLSLKPNDPPIPERISRGKFFGYRRSAKGGNGTWFAKMRDSQTEKRSMTELGSADDYSDSNGIDILTYAEAQKKAVEWFDAELIRMRSEGGEDVKKNRHYTVADAMEAYFKDAARRGLKGIRSAKQSSDKRIIPQLGKIEIDKLTQGKLEKWLEDLAASPKMVHGKLKEPPKTPEEIRARRETSKRILNTLKPAPTFLCGERSGHLGTPQAQG